MGRRIQLLGTFGRIARAGDSASVLRMTWCLERQTHKWAARQGRTLDGSSFYERGDVGRPPVHRYTQRTTKFVFKKEKTLGPAQAGSRRDGSDALLFPFALCC